MSDNHLLLTPEEFAALEDFEIRAALQLATGYLALCQAKMRENSERHFAYMAAKEDFTHYKSIASTLQTLLRAAV